MMCLPLLSVKLSFFYVLTRAHQLVMDEFVGEKICVFEMGMASE